MDAFGNALILHGRETCTSRKPRCPACVLRAVCEWAGQDMSGAGRVLLITGMPGVGKTTLIRRVAERVPGTRLGGFYTEELREAGARTGFRLVDFEGNALTFAHVGFKGPRVSRYGVDVEALDARAEALLAPRPQVALTLVDEIGKMECLSPRFVAAMRHLLASGSLVVATVAKKGEGLIDEAKRWPGATLWEVTHDNRDRLPDEVLAWLGDSGLFVTRQAGA